MKIFQPSNINNISAYSFRGFSPSQMQLRTIDSVIVSSKLGTKKGMAEEYTKVLMQRLASLPDALSDQISSLLDRSGALLSRDRSKELPRSLNPHFPLNIYEEAINSQNQHMRVVNETTDVFEAINKANGVNTKDKNILKTFIVLVRKTIAKNSLNENKEKLIGSIEHYGQDDEAIMSSIGFLEKVLKVKDLK